MGSICTQDVLNRLKALREELSLRQDYLARRVGVDRTTYVRKEGGAIPITTDEWIKIANAMGREPAYFFGASESSKSDLAVREALLVRLYRALRPTEQEDLVCAVFEGCRCIRRRAVRDTLKMLMAKPGPI